MNTTLTPRQKNCTGLCSNVEVRLSIKLIMIMQGPYREKRCQSFDKLSEATGSIINN